MHSYNTGFGNSVNITHLLEQTNYSICAPRVSVWERIRLGLIYIRDSYVRVRVRVWC